MSLADIQTRAKAKPSIVIIYGPSGLGKTTLAVGSKNPIVLQTEEGLGILTNNRDIPHFKLAKDYWAKKYYCDTKFKPPGETTMYIRKSDWINPRDSDFECGIFDMNGDRLKYDDGMPMTIPSRNICNI